MEGLVVPPPTPSNLRKIEAIRKIPILGTAQKIFPQHNIDNIGIMSSVGWLPIKDQSATDVGMILNAHIKLRFGYDTGMILFDYVYRYDDAYIYWCDITNRVVLRKKLPLQTHEVAFLGNCITPLPTNPNQQ